MVVGTGKYENQNEAYPLDKKTLNKVALRSLLVQCGNNAETEDANGWCWAISPALKKIHENDTDLALSMGHNLEYVKTGGFFAPLAMGIVLSLEAQKADLEVIRSTRTTTTMICNSLSHALMELLVFSTLAMCCLSAVNTGSIVAVCVFACIAMCISVASRFVLIRVGYNQGTKMMEKMMRQKDALNHACKLGGIFAIGALIVLSTKYASLSNLMMNFATTSSSMNYLSYAVNGIPGIVGVATTALLYHLLVKKNWSITKCVILIVCIGICFMLLSYFVTNGLAGI